MAQQHSSTERRQHVRVNARGTVIVRGGGRAVRGRSAVVSDHMLEVRCEVGFELAELAGASVEIEMRLDDVTGTWFVLHGQVARVRAATNGIVIDVPSMPAPLVNLLAAENAHPHDVVEVMVVDSDLARRTLVAEAFRSQGCHVVETSTPLEAIDVLANAPYASEVIVVADTSPDQIAVELCGYLDNAYTDALVVSAGDPEWIQTRTRLDASNAGGFLDTGVYSLLRLNRRENEARRQHVD